MQEFIQLQPFNPLVCTSICGHHVGYLCCGSGTDFEGLKNAFTVDEYIGTVLHNCEHARLCLDADCAIQGRDIAIVALYDFSGASLGNMMGVMQCEWEQQECPTESTAKTAHLRHLLTQSRFSLQTCKHHLARLGAWYPLALTP